MIKVYHNPRCTKSRQSLEILDKEGVNYQVIKYLDAPPSTKELEELISLLGIKPIELIRKNEAIWKENYKGKELSDEEIIAAMHQFPKLIERPILVKEKTAVIGRPTEKVYDILK